MLRSEFEQRVNYKVTEEEFKSINEMYMDTDLDKDDFCLLYNASQFITQKVADVARERKQLREEKIQLGYWMADQFQSLLGNWKLPYTTLRNYRNSYPMRFALRNKDKLVNAFGIEAHQLLLDSLKDYARNHEDVSVSGSLPGERSYQVFLVPSLKGTGDRFKFAIIKKVYDVYHVAFVEHMKN